MSSAVSTLFTGRCPHCQQGGIYKSVFELKPTCDVCGAVFYRDPGSWTGATVVTYMAASVWAIGGLIVLWATGTLQTKGTEWIVIGSTAVVSLLLFRFMKAFWVGLLHDWGQVYPDPEPEEDAS